MPDKEQIALMGHLMRRAGFGASYEELVARTARGYEETTVDELLHPERFEPVDNDLLYRFMPGYEGALGPPLNQAEWVYRMINTQRPLEEKMALFWHQLFATGNSKVDNPPELTQQINHVPRARDGQLPRPAGGAGPQPGHDLLAGQQREPHGSHQRELGP